MRRLVNARIPVIGFVAYSGTGKTTLLTRLIPQLCGRGLRVGVVKHAHHDFDIDHPGKDSYRLRHAGAQQMLVASARRWALVFERQEAEPEDPALDDLLLHLDQSILDLVLVEGFKHIDFPKIELHRSETGHPLLFPTDPNIIALATDRPPAAPCPIPLLDLNNPQKLSLFLMNYLREPSA